MRGAIPRFTTIALLIGATGLLALGHPAEVRAQSTLLCPGGTALINGECYDGAFSGAALSSQALSELSETTTQGNSRAALKAVTERREKERERCAEGFTRVDGACQPITPPVREAEAVAPPPPGPGVKKVKKPKGTAVRPEEARVRAVKAAHREKPEPEFRPAAVAPLPTMVCKDQPCAPIPIEPDIRFGAWTQIVGDYEHRNASAPAFVTVGSLGALGIFPIPPAGTRVPVLSSVQSRSSTVGIQAGGDITSRGIWASNDGLIAGIMTGFSYSDLTLNTSALSTNFALVHNLSGQMHATLTGGTVGLYATYFNGGFSTDFLAKADVFSLSENFTDFLAFSAGSIPPTGGCTPIGLFTFGAPFDCVFSKKDPIPVINTTVMGDLNYRFNVYPNFWIEPTVGAQYSHTSYLAKAARLGLADGDLVMVQGGARFGTTALVDNHILVTTTLTGLAYDDVLVSGGFIAAQAFNGNNLLVQADRGQVRGRGILALNFDFGQGISSFVQGEVRGGQGLFGAGGKAGVRVQW